MSDEQPQIPSPQDVSATRRRGRELKLHNPLYAVTVLHDLLHEARALVAGFGEEIAALREEVKALREDVAGVLGRKK